MHIIANLALQPFYPIAFPTLSYYSKDYAFFKNFIFNYTTYFHLTLLLYTNANCILFAISCLLKQSKLE